MFSIAGKANLEKSDLEPALKALKDRLMMQNVVCFSFCSVIYLCFISLLLVLLNHVEPANGSPML